MTFVDIDKLVDLVKESGVACVGLVPDLNGSKETPEGARARVTLPR